MYGIFIQGSANLVFDVSYWQLEHEGSRILQLLQYEAIRGVSDTQAIAVVCLADK